MVGTNAAEGAACLALADLEGALKLLLTLVVLAGAFAKAGFTCGTIAIAAWLVKAWTLGLAKAAFFAAGTVAELALTTWCAVVTFKAGAIACAAFLVEMRTLTAFTAWATVFIEAGTLRAAKAALVTVTARTAAVIAETGAIAARTATIFLLEAWAL